MTADEIKIARALRAIRFDELGTKRHKLAMGLSSMAVNRPTKTISNLQHAAMLAIAIDFRDQISPEIVDLALKLRAQIGRSA